MIILILNWRDIRHPFSGGAEASLFEHAKYWKKRKNEVIWFSSSFQGAKKEETIDGIKFIRKGSHYTAHIWAYLYYISHKFGSVDMVIDSFHFIPFFTPLYMKSKKIISLINEVAGKVWFANLPYIFAFIGYRLEPLFFLFYKNIHFITGSDSTKEELIKIGIKKNNIHIVHHGIRVKGDYSKIKKEKKPTLVFLGRVSTDKGIEDVLDTFILVKKKFKNITLWIIGKEEKSGMIKTILKKIKSSDIKKSIKYFNFVSEEKKFELLKKGWILIHPSKKEGWGLNVIEAASQGTPTVGYNVEGLRDSVKNNETGILVDIATPSLLSEAVLLITLDKEKKLYSQLSQNAIKWAKNFNWGKSTKQSWKIICQVYESHKR